ncbi:TPR repeat protein [Pseudohaliea rubra DSM 19751]|uniref:Cell division coordinator CpoB n=1 Tax=Pseudohaliea rubra DSM 19751 TaxID=1265313 RepID=A0A095VMM2_9GAMM|nr:TPR repeat protein [Pseudohaliea rubra DSM 19751]
MEAERARSGSPTTAQPALARSYGLDSSAGPATVSRPPAPASNSEETIGNLFIQLQRLQQEVMQLNGKVEEQAYELRRLKEQSLERYLDLDRRLAGSGAPTSGNTGESTVIGMPDAGSGAEAAEQPGEGDAYRAAYARVRNQEFDAAVAAFKQFLERFPDGRYAPNAHYWLGELYLVLQPPDPEAARQSFMLLLDQYPGNSKEPDALYKLGRVHYIKGNRERSREFMDRVLRQYPDSSAAGLAGEFIDQNL